MAATRQDGEDQPFGVRPQGNESRLTR
jgi:hypothetical protein